MVYFTAITINRNHEWFKLNNDENTSLELYKDFHFDLHRIKNLILNEIHNIEYINLVIHKNNITDYHIHGLIASNTEITVELLKSKCHHAGMVLNIGKYENYMINHDMIYQVKYGSMPYYDKETVKDNVYDEMIAYFFSSRSAVKTVQRYGVMALKYFNQLKAMEIELD